MKARESAIVPKGRTGDPAARMGPLDGAFRQAVISRLSSLRAGAMTLREGDTAREFGESASDLKATLTVLDPAFYRRVALRAGLGAAEAYVLGMWDCDDLTRMLRIFVRNIPTGSRIDTRRSALLLPFQRLGQWLRRNTLEGSRRNIHAHYDLGNEFFALFLDETMTYSCGIFESEEASLRDASIAKYDRVCRKLRLSPADHLVEIGCGWGGLAEHAATRYGCRVTATTISQEQFAYATRRIEQAGLAGRVQILREDYRTMGGRFDKLASIEMIEAVGERFLGVYFRKLAELLKPDGMMLLQAIVMPDQQYERYRRSVDFIRRYVFPGSFLPSLGAIQSTVGRVTDLRLENVEDIRPHYARTLRLWRERLESNLDQARALGCSERFLRLWNYYLCYCEAGFEERYIGDAQILLAKPGCRAEAFLP